MVNTQLSTRLARVRFPVWELFGHLYDGFGLIVKRLRRGILTPEAWVQLPVRPLSLFLLIIHVQKQVRLPKWLRGSVQVRVL